MPSQVLTRRRVKRRQQRQRLVSKNAKRKVRSVRKHRKTAKKVMRGGSPIVRQYCLFIYPGTDEEIGQLYVNRDNDTLEKDETGKNSTLQFNDTDLMERYYNPPSMIDHNGSWKDEQNTLTKLGEKLLLKNKSSLRSPKYCIPYSSHFLFARITEVVNNSEKEVYISNTGDFFQEDWLEQLEQTNKNKMLKQLVLKLCGINETTDQKTFKAVSAYQDLWAENRYSVIKVTKRTISLIGGTHTISLRYSNNIKWITIGNFTPDQKVSQIFQPNEKDAFMSLVKIVLTKDLDLKDGTTPSIAPASATSTDNIQIVDAPAAAAINKQPRFRLEENINFNFDYANDVRTDVKNSLMDRFELLYRTEDNHKECIALRDKYLPKYKPNL